MLALGGGEVTTECFCKICYQLHPPLSLASPIPQFWNRGKRLHPRRKGCHIFPMVPTDCTHIWVSFVPNPTLSLFHILLSGETHFQLLLMSVHCQEGFVFQVTLISCQFLFIKSKSRAVSPSPSLSPHSPSSLTSRLQCYPLIKNKQERINNALSKQRTEGSKLFSFYFSFFPAFDIVPEIIEFHFYLIKKN